jgi:GPH family glycoside/pentoside/hexuronide:cation symporter
VISPSPRTRTVASTCRFIGAFGAAFLISLFVRPLVKHLGAGSETRGFQLTMAIFAIVSVILILITFATTRERVTPPPQQKTNVREELSELFQNWPWVVLLITSIFSALRSGSTIFYFKYVQGYGSAPVVWGLDRTTLFLTSGALGLVLGTMCLGPIARRIDKKYYASALSLVTGVCFLSFFFIPKGHFGLMVALNMLAQFCAGPTSALTWALYADVADYGEFKYGRRSTGLIYSASLFSIKTGILIGGFLVPLFLAQFGYVKGAETQTARALLGIAIAFSLGPALFALLKALALVIYPLNQKRVDEIEQGLTARRAAASEIKPARPFAIPFCPDSIPTRPSCALAITTTSPLRRSSGSPACRFIIRATSSTGDCSRGRSIALANSTCSAIPIPAASGHRA